MKKLSILLALAMAVSLLAGCSGTTVVYSNCTCPTGSHDTAVTPTESVQTPAAEGAVKTGLYIGTDISESKAATADSEGQAKYDVTVVAVTVDDQGIIRSCAIDSIPATVTFDATGTITSDLTAAVPTKGELGENYGMVAYGNAVAEWDAQVAALASYAVGKTVEELRSGAIDETGYASDVDLATTATIYLGGYVSAIEAAAANASHLGAQAGDTLKLATINTLDSSVSAEGDTAGTVQLDASVVVLTMNGDTVTSCRLDALQGKISFDAAGVITTDLTAPLLTKNELGEAYGMKAWGGATYEWNEQAANFAAYVTGKTAADVAGIAVNEKTAPAEADLATSVTISIGGFQALIAKATNNA